MIEIPKYDHTKGELEEQLPCWIGCIRETNNKERFEAKERNEHIEPIYENCKPSIVCICGRHTGVMLKLLNYDKGEFLPVKP